MKNKPNIQTPISQEEGGLGADVSGLTGLVKLSGGSASQAMAGTDYYAPGETDVSIADGGTGASDAAGARANLAAQEQSALLDNIAGLSVSPGDMMYVDSSNEIARLPKGTDDQVLTLTSGIPSWADRATGIPMGSVVSFAGTSAPEGWLFLYGQAISRTTYADLFAVLGTTYGNGDGSTTFNLPDLRGRVVAGTDNMGGTSANRLTSPVNGDHLGTSGGAESHTLTTSQMPSHSHAIGSHSHSIGAHSHSYTRYSGSLQWLQNGTGHTLNGIWTNTSSQNTVSSSPTCSSVSPSCSSVGSGSSHNNVQPTFVLNYIIFAGVV